MQRSVEDDGLRQRAYWLIQLRWLAGVSVALGTFVCARVLGIGLQERALYGIAILLLVYNGVVLALLNRFARGPGQQNHRGVERVINGQISADLVILATLLHFSGGVENPFVFFFIFHMIIASILLPVRESYLQATLAVSLFGVLALLEYREVMPHHCLTGFVGHCQYQERSYVLGTFLVFTLTLYLVVYMASYIAVRLRRAERAQMEANEQLREKDRIKDEYVAHLTHDIKGHLAAIQSCLGVAITGSLTGQAADFVGRAFHRTRKLTAFVRMLLRLTRMKLDAELERTVFSLNEVVHSAVDSVREAAQEKSINLCCTFEPLKDTLSADRNAIEEIIVSLLQDAIKYTPAHGTVSIETAVQADSILLQVCDTGIGVPEGERDKIFDEFYRGSNAREVERQGAGLGLSLVKHVVDVHGGSISVSSTEGSGTTFRIVLPRALSGKTIESAATVGRHCVCPG